MSEIFEAILHLLLPFSMVIVMLIYTPDIFKNAQSLVAPNRLVRRTGGAWGVRCSYFLGLCPLSIVSKYRPKIFPRVVNCESHLEDDSIIHMRVSKLSLLEAIIT